MDWKEFDGKREYHILPIKVYRSQRCDLTLMVRTLAVSRCCQGRSRDVGVAQAPLWQVHGCCRNDWLSHSRCVSLV